MKTIITTFLVSAGILLFSGSAKAQEQFVVGSAGVYSELSTGSFAWTIGEMVIVTASIPSNDLTQGFHQYPINVIGIEENKLNPLEISVYPNPADDIINIETDKLANMSIYDMQGKLIDNMDLSSTTTQVDVSYLSRGTYLLMFQANGALAKQMKIVIQ